MSEYCLIVILKNRMFILRVIVDFCFMSTLFSYDCKRKADIVVRIMVAPLPAT
jgi:hypothetical protein